MGLFRSSKTDKTAPNTSTPGTSSSSGSSNPPQQPPSDGVTTEDVLQTTSTLLDVLAKVGDAAGLLGPLKVICGVLKVAADTALAVVSNKKDLEGLVVKLQNQQKILQREMDELSKPEFNGLKDVQGIIDPLRDYVQNLLDLQSELLQIQKRYSKRNGKTIFKVALKFQQDQVDIAGYTQKLQDSFQHFINSLSNFTARQTVLIRSEVVTIQKTVDQLQDRMAEQNAKSLLNQLTYAEARGNQHRPCLKGTRIRILEEITQWGIDEGAKPIICLVDQAGTGKSTIATHMTRTWELDSRLLARFYFSKPSTITGKNFASTLAKDIARSIPALSSLVLDAVEKNSDYATCSIQEQLELLVFPALRSLPQQQQQQKTSIIVIDALDECNPSDRQVILSSLLDFIASYSPGSYPLKIFLSFRPDDDLVRLIRRPSNAQIIHQTDFALHSTKDVSNRADIHLYAVQFLTEYLLTPERLDLFVERANGLFIWATTAHSFLASAFDAVDLFETLMKSDSSLDSLYQGIIVAAIEKAPQQKEMLQRLLQAICVAREPLTADALDALLELRTGVSERIVSALSSVLSDGTSGKQVHVLHSTFVEYLLKQPDPSSSNNNSPPFSISTPQAEALVAKGCMKTLATLLRYDICGILKPRRYPPENAYIKDLDQRIQKNTTFMLRYAAVFGLSHVASSLQDGAVVEAFRSFLKRDVLHWIELVGLLGKTLNLLRSVQHLKTRIEDSLSEGSDILTGEDKDWCQEILTLVLPFQTAMRIQIMQLYFSALPFTAPTSHISRHYLHHFVKSVPKVLRGRRDDTSSQPVVLSGHIRAVSCLAYSPTGLLIASGSEDGTVRLWDSSTGAIVEKLEKAADKVRCLSFSTDGKLLASGSDDGLIRIWDPTAGQLVKKLEGHTSAIWGLEFLPTGNCLVSASEDRTLRLWDAFEGKEIRQFTDELEEEYPAMCLSPDGTRVASGTEDRAVHVWDTTTGASVVRLVGHRQPIKCITFSPDGSRLVSGDSYGVKLWDPIAGTSLPSPSNSDSQIFSLAFSPNSQLLVYGSYKGTIYRWDVISNTTKGELLGHTNCVYNLIFTSNGQFLVSGSGDCNVRIWNPIDGTTLCQLAGHTDMIRDLTFSIDGHRIASASDDHTIRLWEFSTAKLASEVGSRSSDIRRLIFSPDGTRLASSSNEPIVRLWDPTTGKLVSELVGHTDQVYCIAFSPNSCYLASGGRDLTVRIWDAATGAPTRCLCGHTGMIWCLAFTPDSSYLASGSADNTARIWDVETGAAVDEPIKHTRNVTTLTFHIQNQTLTLIMNGEFTIDQLPIKHAVDVQIPLPQNDASFITFKDGWTWISTAGILFSLPSYFQRRKSISYKSIAAYGAENGSVIIVDCGHLV